MNTTSFSSYKATIEAANGAEVSAENTIASISLVDSCAKEILSWPCASSSLLPNLASHISNCKQHSMDWETTYQPNIEKLLKESYLTCDVFLGHQYSKLKEALSTIESLKANMISLTETKVSFETIKVQSQDVTEQILNYKSQSLEDVAHFATDAKQAIAQCDSDERLKKNLEKQLNDLESKIARDKNWSRIGWLAGPLGYLTARELEKLITNEKTLKKRVEDLHKEIDNIDQELDNLSSFSSMLEKMISSISQLNIGLQSFTTEWAFYLGFLDNVLDGKIEPGPFAQAELDTIRDNIIELKETIDIILA
ncbi:HBL/NHE enterotoxin family protein [Enterovibrio sp. Hal110]